MKEESFLQLVLGSQLWPPPDSRDFAELSDPIVFAEVLEITHEEESVSLQKLTSETQGLRKRLRRLWVVEKPTKTTINGLLSAMKKFGWLKEDGQGMFRLTNDGLEMYNISKDEKHFRRKLAEKMYQRFVIPGWIVSRLHALNPEGQGEIILPSIPKDWQAIINVGTRQDWPDDWTKQLVTSAEKIRKLFPGSFPIDNGEWVDLVRKSWERLETAKQSSSQEDQKAINIQGFHSYKKRLTPRARLTQAMREAAINQLFSSHFPVSHHKPNIEVADFSSSKHPIPPRAFGAWCPRLDALEFVFYTDYHPLIPGRLLFPCGIFRDQARTPPFERLSEIKDPYGKSLYLYQPTWDEICDRFTKVTMDTYQRASRKLGALYVSLLDLRDEVCRQLRLSSILFDSLMEIAYRESIQESSSLKYMTISLESDIREEQRSGYGLLRRPVYVNKVPHSLIAISLKRHH